MGALPQHKEYDLDRYLDINIPSAKEINEKRKEREKILQRMQLLKLGMALFTLVILLCFIYVGMQVKVNQLNREITYIEEQIEIQKSERTRLEMELSSMFTPTAIEAYAEEHGMIKAESYQISYIDLSEGDKVIVSGGKDVPKEEDSLWYKIKYFFKEGE